MHVEFEEDGDGRHIDKVWNMTIEPEEFHADKLSSFFLVLSVNALLGIPQRPEVLRMIADTERRREDSELRIHE